MGKFYPDAPAEKETVVIDKAVEAAGIIQKMEDGMSEECALKFRKPSDRLREAKPGEKVAGDEMSKQDIIACQLAGRDCFDEVAAVYDEVIAEQKVLAAVNPADFDTEKKYKDELAKKAVYADPAKWCDGMKAEKKVNSWADLKAACTPEEIV
jgi:hypothetical protein